MFLPEKASGEWRGGLRVWETWGRDLKMAWGPLDGVWSTEGELEVSPGGQVSGGWGLESDGC